MTPTISTRPTPPFPQVPTLGPTIETPSPATPSPASPTSTSAPASTSALTPIPTSTREEAQTQTLEEQPLQGLWTTLAPMPTERSEVAAVDLDGKIYVFGGFGAGATANEEYDPSTNTW